MLDWYGAFDCGTREEAGRHSKGIIAIATWLQARLNGYLLPRRAVFASLFIQSETIKKINRGVRHGHLRMTEIIEWSVTCITESPASDVRAKPPARDVPGGASGTMTANLKNAVTAREGQTGTECRLPTCLT